MHYSIYDIIRVLNYYKVEYIIDYDIILELLKNKDITLYDYGIERSIEELNDLNLNNTFGFNYILYISKFKIEIIRLYDEKIVNMNINSCNMNVFSVKHYIVRKMYNIFVYELSNKELDEYCNTINNIFKNFIIDKKFIVEYMRTYKYELDIIEFIKLDKTPELNILLKESLEVDECKEHENI